MPNDDRPFHVCPVTNMARGTSSPRRNSPQVTVTSTVTFAAVLVPPNLSALVIAHLAYDLGDLSLRGAFDAGIGPRAAQECYNEQHLVGVRRIRY